MGALLVTGCAALLIEVPDITGEHLTGRLASDIATLASDEFQGRRPGTPGGKKTVEYIERRFREIGLGPGNGDSYLQPVTMNRMVPEMGLTLTLTGDSGSQELFGDSDFSARVNGNVPLLSFSEHEIVLVGFGIEAPEYDWDDYADTDVTGKVVLMFRNDPGYGSGDSTLFGGRKNTRHGSYRRKFALARDHDAAAAFVIWDEDLSDSDYSWTQTRRYMGAGRTVLSTDEQPKRPEFARGVIYVEAARRIFDQTGLDYDSLVAVAATPGFKAFLLDLTLTGELKSPVEDLTSHNVMGLVRGWERPDELVIYMGHWDHLGVDTTLESDQIFNGAVDNATGTAAVISLAEEFAGLPEPPKRTIMFLAFTSEEMGLLGSRWYVENPVFPLTKTAAVINIDMIYPYSEPRDLEVFGLGKSQLDGYLRRAAAKQGMVVEEDRRPAESIYFRSDHINLARKGVPALYMTNGIDDIQRGREWGLEQVRTYDDSLYHTVNDEFNESWNLNGLENFMQIVFDVGYTIGNQSKFPNWKRGDDFRAIRDEALKAARAAETVSTD